MTSVEVEHHNKIALLRFNPGENGTMNVRTAAEWLQAVEAVIADDSQRLFNTGICRRVAGGEVVPGRCKSKSIKAPLLAPC